MENDEIGYIYESPDSGDTVYRRHINEVDRELVKGTDINLFSYAAFKEMQKIAETNIALKKALDNLLLIYYTIKDDKNTS